METFTGSDAQSSVEESDVKSVVGYIKDTAWDHMSAVWYYRCYLPLREVHRHDNDIEAHVLDAEKVKGLGGAWPDFDVYHWPRMSHGDAEAFVEEIHRRGGKFVIDSDDDLTETYRLVSGRGEAFKKVIGLADHVTVTTQGLADRLAQYTQRPPVVLKNCVDTDWMVKEAKKAKRMIPGLTIGFTGSPTHWGDWHLPAVPLQRICRDFDVVPILHGDKLPRYLQWIAPVNDLIRLGGTPFSIYPILLAQFDVVLCAVDVRDEFNVGKSAVKALECMALGVVPICSRFTPYLDLHEAGAPVIIVEEDSRDGWYEAMRKVITNESARLELQEWGPGWVRERRDMCQTGHRQWERFYEEITE